MATQATADEELRDTEERLHAALDASGTGTFRWHVDTNAVDCDDNLDRLFGFQPGIAVRSLDEFLARVHPDDRHRVSDEWARCARGAAEFDDEFRAVWPDQTVHWLHSKAKTACGTNGMALYVTGACVDISKRRHDEDELSRQQEQLRESEALLRELVEASPLGIVMMDLDGNPVYYNPRCEELHGMRLREASARGWKQAVHPDDREYIAASWHDAVARGHPWSQTYRFLHRDGQVVWVSGRTAPMRIEGKPAGFVGMLEDITLLKLAEGREHEAREQAERATRLRDEMMSIVAHDLRNPLHIFIIVLNRLLSRPRSDPTRELSILQRTAHSMEALIRDLLDVSRVESGSFAVEPAPVQVRELLDGALELFEVPARASEISLSCEVEPGVPALLGERARLTQVLWNLLGNALKFTPPHGAVSLHARRRDRFVEISVEDTGPGIPAEDLPHVFDRFWQAHRTSGVGTGLGLAIARGIVEAHGGRIRVDSTPGRGAAFCFTIPCSAS